ncbi:Pumilio -like protein 3 [Halotydeus destructor]|nr:Pumilio -like protein 3 [Halotydeus destructor]
MKGPKFSSKVQNQKKNDTMGVLAKPAGKRANKPGFKKDKKLPGQHGQFKKSPDKFKGKKNVPKKFEKKTELSNDDTDVQRKKGTKRKQLELSSEEKKRVRFSDQLDDRNRDSDADEDESVDAIEDEDVEDENVSDEEVSEAEAEEEEEKEDEGFKGETLDSQAEASVEPKKSSKELRREQKKIKQDRKMRKNKFFELATQAKQIWEEVRPADCPKEKRVQLIDQLTSQIKGSVKEIIRAHDTVRVVECIVQHGSDKHRTMMFDELKDMIVDLSMSKYGRFFVLKMLKYGSRDQKAKIISSFYGHVTKLLKHKEAALVVETAYNEVANAKQRALLVQEFYGPEFKVFKDDTTVTLEQVLEKASESQKKKLLTDHEGHVGQDDREVDISPQYHPFSAP